MAIIIYLQAILLGILEGLTEFIPVSSTGHLIIGAHLLKVDHANINVFEIFIQLGAILAIVYEYRSMLIEKVLLIQTKSSQHFFINILIASIPAAVIGLLFHDHIKMYLFNPVPVSIALIIGGVLILFIEKQIKYKQLKNLEQLSKTNALGIGLFQCLALIPGTSRSGATIMGGLILKLDRKTATEFSFFLAIPIMFAATFYDLYKNYSSLSQEDTLFFLIGFVVSFFTALVIIRFLIKFVSNNDFKIFAYYRIIFGLFFLVVFI
jgi:undecaprenyl-diphosphatase